MVWWAACPLALAVASYAAFGSKGLTMFVGQAAGAVLLLEVVRIVLGSKTSDVAVLSACAAVINDMNDRRRMFVHYHCSVQQCRVVSNTLLCIWQVNYLEHWGLERHQLENGRCAQCAQWSASHSKSVCCT